jgi:PPOX class probable F420-dependent enzyme
MRSPRGGTLYTDFIALEDEQYISLTTWRKNGVAIATPVWFAAQGDRIYLYTDASAGKVKRIRANARVTVAPCTSRGDVTGPTIIATARIVTDPAEQRQAIAALARKYRLRFRLWRSLSPLLARFRRGPRRGWVYIAITTKG